jgi:hypothetical protein
MDQYNNSTIVTDCGKEFELNKLEAIGNGSINANTNYTFTIYKSPTEEYIQKKSFFNPAMNHTSVNYEVIPASAFLPISASLEKP